jgi:hypothetical protein
MCNKRAEERKCSASVSTEEVVDAAREAITRSPRKGVRLLDREWGLNQHCMNTLPGWLVSIQNVVEQPLSEDGTVRRFCLAKGTARHWRIVRVSRMAHGSPMKHVSTMVLTLTSRMSSFWASEYPRLTVANTLHPERFTVWCALWSVGIFGLFFIDGAATSEECLSLLSQRAR